MRRRRVRTALFAWVTTVVLAWAAAADAPEAVAAALTAGDADVLVTDARGVIVGVGRVVAGASFELRVLDGFVGSARLTLLRPDGATEALEIVVDDSVLVHGLDLLELLADGFEAFTVEVGGVAYHEAERRRTAAGESAADGPRPGPGPADPSGPPERPGPPDGPGGPNSPGGPGDSPPRGSEGRP